MDFIKMMSIIVFSVLTSVWIAATITHIVHAPYKYFSLDVWWAFPFTMTVVWLTCLLAGVMIVGLFKLFKIKW